MPRELDFQLVMVIHGIALFQIQVLAKGEEMDKQLLKHDHEDDRNRKTPPNHFFQGIDL